MKAIFKTFDQEKKMRLNKDDLLKYFSQLKEDMGYEFKTAANVSEECYDDVLWEFDY